MVPRDSAPCIGPFPLRARHANVSTRQGRSHALQGFEGQVISNIIDAERYVRIALAAAFGLAFLGNALLLTRGVEPSPLGNRSGASSEGDQGTPRLRLASRLAFQLGTACAVASATLALVNPLTSVSNLVYLGVALVIALATLATDRAARGVPALAFLSSGLIWLLAVGAAYFAPTHGTDDKPLGALAWVHIVTATLASGLFVAAFLASLLYLVGYKWLKARKFESRPALPSLEFLDNLVERTSLVGLFLITTSLVSGLGLLFTGVTLESVGTAKILWAFAVWILYSVSLFGRGFWGWRGRRGALLSVCGTLLIAGSLFGTLLRTP